MAKRAPAQYEPPPVPLDEAPFDETSLRDILIGARVREAPEAAALAFACERLNNAAIWLKMQQGLHEAPTEASSRETIQRILKAATALRRELPVVDADGLNGAEANPRVIDGITRLLTPTMTRLMRERVAAERDQRGKGPEADEIFGARNVADAFLVLTNLLDLLAAASTIELESRDGSRSVKTASPLRDFVWSAGQAYRELTGEQTLRLSRSYETGKLQGPLIPFIEGCCRQVGETKVKRETLADWIRAAQASAEPSASPE